MSSPELELSEQLLARRDAGAADALRRWLATNPREQAQFARAATVALSSGDAALALAVAERFVACVPKFPGSHHALGLARVQSGDFAGAVAALRAALALAPGTPGLRLHLAGALVEAGDARAGVAELDSCLAARPDWAEARMRRAIARLRAYDGPGAHEDFAWWTSVEPANPNAWRGLAEAAELVGRHDEARNARAREIALAPGDLDRRREQGLALSRMGRNLEARAALEEVLAARPGDLSARWVHWNLTPFTYADEADVAAWRARWLDGLAELEAMDVAQLPPGALADAMVLMPNFFVHYQGGDLAPLQRRYGALVSRWASHAFPAVAARSGPRREGRLRVGIASAYIRNHTVWGLFERWIAELDRTRFEVIVFALGPVEDEATATARASADRLVRGYHTNDAWVAALAQADLDALVWLDIGMDGLTQLLAALRFAPVTAMAWGHPVTSGLPSVDYFLTGDAMEPDGADAHYAEKLVRLPGIGISYPHPEGDDAPRATRTSGAPRLFCAQSIYKFHPRNYELIVRLAQALPEAQFDFVPHPAAAARMELGDRLRHAFAAAGMDFDARATLHPFMPREAFIALMRGADAMIDTFGWSGGHTTLEALSTDLPVVTSPGEFMRARHTHGMLKLLGLDGELAARDLDHYVAIVARLVRDPAFHARCVATIRARKHVLYEDRAPIRALGDFLWRACGR
ncbi:MAG TPA: tetratricopeptide repeat protein [Xanthomonadales bacterium]|nr:tetratricopeptide repeat protein [Xanthomonadales bacterium]